MPNKLLQPNTEKEILNKSLVYSFSNYIRMFVKLLGGFFIAKFLGPALYGLRNAFDLSLNYETFSDLGTFASLNRQAPYYRGANDSTKFNTALSTVFSINIIYASIAATLLLLTSWYLRRTGFDQKYVDFIFFLGLMVFTGKFIAFFVTELKIDKNFYLLSKVQVLYGVSASGLGIVLAYLFSFRGVLISLLSTNLICITYILFNERKLPPIRISFPMYWNLLKIGFPMMVLFGFFMLLSSADRILILAMISEEALGYFGIAMVAAAVIATIPQAVHNVTLAPIMEKLGRTGDKHSIKHFFIEPMVLMAYTLPSLLACLHFAIHLPIAYFLTKYMQSIEVIKILILGYFFYAVASPALSVSFALNKQVKLIFLTVPIVGINFLLNYIFIKSGWGLKGVAIGTSITYFCYFCAIVFFTLSHLDEPLKAYPRTLVVILIPIFYTVLLFWIIDTHIQLNQNTIWSDIFATSIKIGLFILSYSLVFLKIKDHPAFQKLFNNLFILKYFKRTKKKKDVKWILEHSFKRKSSLDSGKKFVKNNSFKGKS